MKNELGDKCCADSMTARSVDGVIEITAEVDGILFESWEYDSHQAWLQDIVERVYACAMGKLN